ncbi:hypothetical protein [Actinomadura rugatobispora]|uniref:Uncharacterized protein n=1 Tax=Actinomadura rugatobispora TaxID=1994 RepID=A0ABW1A5Q7_9ACTN
MSRTRTCPGARYTKATSRSPPPLGGAGRHAGAAYDLNGPEFTSYRDQVRVLAEAIGEEIRFERVTPEEARELYRRQGGFAADNADFLLGFTDYSGNDADPADAADFDLASYGPFPTSEAVTGRPARTFAEWAGEHAADFR